MVKWKIQYIYETVIYTISNKDTISNDILLHNRA